MEKDNKERNTTDNNTVSLRNTLNELTGSEWLYFTKSILITAYPCRNLILCSVESFLVRIRE